ncbi:MAG: hypothetical protein AAGA71_16220 [Pseudomonadota bacterium]
MVSRSAKPPPARVSDAGLKSDRLAGVFWRGNPERAAWKEFALTLIDPFWMSAARLEEMQDQLDGMP